MNEASSGPSPAELEEVRQLVEILKNETQFDRLAVAAKNMGTTPQAWATWFEQSRATAVTIVRRLDRGAAEDLSSIQYDPQDSQSRAMAAQRALFTVDAASRAALIAGPASDSTNQHNVDVEPD